MSKPRPAHHREVEIPSGAVASGYGGVRGSARDPCIIVAASPVNAAKPPQPGMVRVIVAPARGPS